MVSLLSGITWVVTFVVTGMFYQRGGRCRRCWCVTLPRGSSLHKPCSTHGWHEWRRGPPEESRGLIVVAAAAAAAVRCLLPWAWLLTPSQPPVCKDGEVWQEASMAPLYAPSCDDDDGVVRVTPVFIFDVCCVSLSLS